LNCSLQRFIFLIRLSITYCQLHSFYCLSHRNYYWVRELKLPG
jgi:hypothetical protein